MRNSTIVRKTSETEIQIDLNLDGSGITEVDTGVGFLDHMLTLFGFHGKFDLSIKCKGDLNTDTHHTSEDVGIALGACLFASSINLSIFCEKSLSESTPTNSAEHKAQ
jgi:imidazoleglycerol-phosphate dehydratase